MLNKFITYQLAKQFYSECQVIKLPYYLKNQLLRASSSVALNLAEGNNKQTPKERRRFFFIALGSLRECQAILELHHLHTTPSFELADKIGACLWRLCHPKN